MRVLFGELPDSPSAEPVPVYVEFTPEDAAADYDHPMLPRLAGDSDGHTIISMGFRAMSGIRHNLEHHAVRAGAGRATLWGAVDASEAHRDIPRLDELAAYSDLVSDVETGLGDQGTPDWYASEDIEVRDGRVIVTGPSARIAYLIVRKGIEEEVEAWGAEPLLLKLLRKFDEGEARDSEQSHPSDEELVLRHVLRPLWRRVEFLREKPAN